MTVELELLSNYMRSGRETPFDLARETQRFRELLDAEVAGENAVPRDRVGGRAALSRRRLTALVGAGGAIAAAMLLVVLLVPTVGQHQPVAAAAALKEIAVNAGNQPVPQLSDGQLLHTSEQVSMFAQVSQVGSTPTPDAQATVGATVQQWSDKQGNSCISATSGTAQFASPVNAAAWKSAGLLDSPSRQPLTTCYGLAGQLPYNTDPAVVMNVSGLTTDPSVLAGELATGTTGIRVVDQRDSEITRAAMLLIGPTNGASPQITAAIYGALSTMPGIRALGQLTTHSGATGLGFAANSFPGETILIVDQATGALLEARNVVAPFLFEGIGRGYLAPPPTPSIGTEGGSDQITLQWLDPEGSPALVGSNALPAGLSMSPPPD
jgi:hypothetical protein